MEEMKALVRRVDAGLAKLIAKETDIDDKLATDAKSRARSDKRRDWLIGLLIAAVVLAGAVIVRVVLVSNCSTDRTRALSGPSTDRVNLFLQAYTEAAGQIDHPLTDEERATVIGGLLRDRETFTVLPDRAKLEKSTDFQLLAYRDLVASLRANTAYNLALSDHPVCSFWGF